MRKRQHLIGEKSSHLEERIVYLNFESSLESAGEKAAKRSDHRTEHGQRQRMQHEGIHFDMFQSDLQIMKLNTCHAATAGDKTHGASRRRHP